ncbi:unnamed protein product, partial [Symbiodinium sp. CCMP2456]
RIPLWTCSGSVRKPISYSTRSALRGPCPHLRGSSVWRSLNLRRWRSSRWSLMARWSRRRKRQLPDPCQT